MSLLSSGELFANRFEIDGVAGAGGMGTVYRARDQLSGDVVALKLLHGHGTDPNEGERFIREAQLLSELRHPGIVTHIAHGRTPQGLRYLAMQWLDGEDLSQRLARRQLSLSEVLSLAERVAQALAFAHQHSVVHRDLKPTNLFLPGGDVSQVKILDFGIARRISTARAMTRTGIVIGTPEYMAPEQARGARSLTAAADIFSFGCVLYECLAGEPPFVAEHIAAVLVRILFEEPIPLDQRRPGVPAGLQNLLSRMLAKDPTQRIASAQEVAAALATLGTLPVLGQHPTLAAPVRTPPVDAESEQVLLSLVLALAEQHNLGDGSPMVSAAVATQAEQHDVLLGELRRMGAQADLLPGGALVVTMPPMSSAKDQAALAARCATMVREHWPEARVAVVTGRGSRSRGLLSGEVLERAWRLLRLTATAPDASAEVVHNSKVILLDEVSAGLLAGRFELEPVSAAQDAYALGMERLDQDAERRLLGKPTPCVGRERELSSLEAMLTECKDELVARAVLVLAPPGLGKSRLRHEFVRRLESRKESATMLIGRGDPLKTRSAYGLLGEALRQRLDIRGDQPPDEQRARLRALITAALPADEAQRVTVFMGELCGVPFPDEENLQLRAARQDPRIMSDQVEQAWLDCLPIFHSSDPIILILEDLHWSDALTVKLVEAALRRLRDHAFMVLALARPEVLEQYPNLWAGAVQPLPLHPLARKASERLVRLILGAEVVSEQITRVVEQSAGNPLFLEELIRATAARKTTELPETVAAMIQARIGRLNTGSRRALRAASVFGETFWENGVRRMLSSAEEDSTVRYTLDDLIREEIIERSKDRQFGEEPQYRFRHALVRDAAYALTNEHERKAWHAAAGTFLESVGERESIILAEHYRLGGELPRAAHCYAKAAEQVHDAGDVITALSCVEHGLACGASGVDRGALLSVQITSVFWREQYQEIIRLAPEALAVLPPGSKLWCQVFIGFLPALGFLQQTELLAKVCGHFLEVMPRPDAVACYLNALSFLSSMACHTGQRAQAESLSLRLIQVSTALTPQDRDAWAYVYIEAGFRNNLIQHRPYTSMLAFQNARQATQDAGNRKLQAGCSAYCCKLLFELCQIDAALTAGRAGLFLIEQASEALTLAFSQLYMARTLVGTGEETELREAEQLCHAVLQGKNQIWTGQAHGVLARIAFQRSNLPLAESEARLGCQELAAFPPYRADLFALWSRVLSALGNETDSLRVCEEGMLEQQALSLESYGLIDLYVALADALSRAGRTAELQQTLARALPVLRSWALDIPEPAMRTGYLKEVPAHARLLALAAANQTAGYSEINELSS